MATNQQILDALVTLGLPGAASLSTWGGQSTDFRLKLRDAGIPDGIIDQAFRLARGEQPDMRVVTETFRTSTIPQALTGAPAGPPNVPVGPMDRAFTAPATTPRPRAVGPQPTGSVSGTPTGNVLSGAVRPSAPPPPPPSAPPSGGAGETLAGTRGTTTTTDGSQAPGGAAAPKLAPNASDAEAEAFIRKTYGFMSWALDVPELAGALRNAARDLQGADVDKSRLEGYLTSTGWWKTHTENQRTAEEQRSRDPETYRVNINGEFQTLKTLAGQIGLSVSDARLREIAQTSYDMDWNATEQKFALSAEFDYSPDTGAQAQSKVVGDLKAEASKYLIPLSEGTIDDWGRQIVAGTTDVATFGNYLKEQAKSLFPSLSAALDSGVTVSQYVEPYRQLAAERLEMMPGAVNFMDPQWMRAIQQVDPKSGARTSMTLSDFDQMIRTDPTYGYDKTNQAKKLAVDLVTTLGRTFGKA